jgi:hypothetical protein
MASRIPEVSIRIAGITLTAAGAQEDFNLELMPALQPFQVNETQTDIRLRCYYSPAPAFPSAELVFASGGPWSLYRQDRQFIFHLEPDPPDLVAIVNQLFSNVDVYYYPQGDPLPEQSPLNSPGPMSFDPFSGYLDELLMINFLARGRGVIFHACGVVDEGRGLMFLGVSGAGKSTIAELWKQRQVTLLSDDRIIVRWPEGQFKMYGTPWHGDARIASPESAPLERLYLIEHASRNYVRDLSPADAAARMLVRCFPPFYDGEGMAFILEFFSRLAEEIPCYELGFVPDASAIDFVRGVK